MADSTDEPSALSVGMSGALSGFVFSSAVAGAHHFHQGFRRNVSPSGKVAAVVMATTFRLVYDMQLEISRQNKANFRRQAEASAKRRGGASL